MHPSYVRYKIYVMNAQINVNERDNNGTIESDLVISCLDFRS